MAMMKWILPTAALVAMGAAACAGQQDRPVAALLGATTAQQHPVAAGPGDAYLLYQDTLHRAASLDEVLPYLSATNQGQIKSTVPPAAQPRLLRAFKNIEPTNVRVDRVELDGDRATLEVHGDAKGPLGADDATRAFATIEMVRENGVWRVAREDWVISGAPAPAGGPQ